MNKHLDHIKRQAQKAQALLTEVDLLNRRAGEIINLPFLSIHPPTPRITLNDEGTVTYMVRGTLFPLWGEIRQFLQEGSRRVSELVPQDLEMQIDVAMEEAQPTQIDEEVSEPRTLAQGGAKLIGSRESDLDKTTRNQPSSRQGLYLTGPIGIGKTHFGIAISCILRADPQYRLVNVPNCKDWNQRTHYVYRAMDYLLEEVLFAFAQDLDDPDLKLSEHYEDFLRHARSGRDVLLDKFFGIIDQLDSWCKPRNIKIVWLFDQINSLDSAKTFPFTLPQQFAGSNDWDFRVIAIASANNEHYPIDLEGFWIRHITPVLCPDEIRAFLGSRGVDQWTLVDDDVELLGYWTHGFFLELNWFAQKYVTEPHKPFSVVLRDYVRERKTVYGQEYKKFIESQSAPEMLRSAVAHMLLRTPMAERPIYYDRRLIQIVKVPNNPVCYKVCPIHAIAREAISSSYKMNHLTTELEVTYRTVMRSDKITNDTKGRIIELYFIEILQRQRKFDFPATTAATGTEIKRLVGDIDIVHSFAGNAVPLLTQNECPPTQNTLLIPLIPNYPYIDVLLYLGRRKMLIAIQVTIKEDLNSHIRESTIGFFGKTSQTWADRVKIDASQILLLFVTAEGNLTRYRERFHNDPPLNVGVVT